MERPYLTRWKQYLTEQTDPSQPAAAVPVRWKDLAKQGYETPPGGAPPANSATFYDANITAVANDVSNADMTVQKLLRDRKIFTWSQQGIIVHRKLDTGKIESKYLSKTAI